jgi:hypothetical protein
LLVQPRRQLIHAKSEFHERQIPVHLALIPKEEHGIARAAFVHFDEEHDGAGIREVTASQSQVIFGHAQRAFGTGAIEADYVAGPWRHRRWMDPMPEAVQIRKFQ